MAVLGIVTDFIPSGSLLNGIRINFQTLILKEGAMKKLLALAALMLAVPAFNQQAVSAATIVRISQESAPGVGDFDRNPFTLLEAYSTSKTAAEFYQYNIGYGASFNGSVEPLIAEQSRLFFLDAADGLSLFLIHDRPANSDGGSARMLFQLLGDTAELKISDDLAEATQNTNGTLFTTNFLWNSCCTDGLVIGSLDGNWQMSAHFTAKPIGLKSWYAYSATGSSKIPLSMQPNRRIRFQSSAVATPEPSYVIPLALGSLLFIQRRLKSTF